MEAQIANTTETGCEVLVHVDSDHGVRQPATFRCCPLGVQFYSERQVPQYSILNFTLSIPENPHLAKVECSGAVVHCEKLNGDVNYRIWLYFLDLPETARPHLHCFAKEASFLCPFCENF